MKEKFELIELKLKTIEKTQENFITHNQLENINKASSEDIKNKINLEVNKINERIAQIEKSKMDSIECHEKLAGFAPIKALEKFNQTIFEIKNEIERNIERKFNDEISTLKYKIDNTIKEDDVQDLISGLATKDDLNNAQIDFDKFDFAVKGKRLKKFIDQCIND